MFVCHTWSRRFSFSTFIKLHDDKKYAHLYRGQAWGFVNLLENIEKEIFTISLEAWNLLRYDGSNQLFRVEGLWIGLSVAAV